MALWGLKTLKLANKLVNKKHFKYIFTAEHEMKDTVKGLGRPLALDLVIRGLKHRHYLLHDK